MKTRPGLWSSSSDHRAGGAAFLFSAPAVLVLTATILFPLGYAVVLSCQQYVLTMPNHSFVGLDNYARILESSTFWGSLGTTCVFALSAVVLVIGIGFLVGLLLNVKFPLRGVLRAVILVPWAVPPVVNGLIWKWLLDPKYGVINGLGVQWGLLDTYQPWLTQMPQAFFWVVTAYVWSQIPLAALLLLAGLQTIPRSLYEAAEVDGANVFQRLTAVTLPSIKPVVLVLLIFETVSALKAFDIIYVLTGGGPGDSTTVLGWAIYSTTFQQLNFGQGSALAILLGLVTMVLAVVFFKTLGKNREE